MPSELRQFEINLRNALDRRIANEEETMAALCKEAEDQGRSDLEPLIEESQARRRAYDTALWEIDEALMQMSSNSIARRKKTLAALDLLGALDDAYEGNFRQIVQQTLRFILEEML